MEYSALLFLLVAAFFQHHGAVADDLDDILDKIFHPTGTSETVGPEKLTTVTTLPEIIFSGANTKPTPPAEGPILFAETNEVCADWNGMRGTCIPIHRCELTVEKPKDEFEIDSHVYEPLCIDYLNVCCNKPKEHLNDPQNKS